MRTSTTSDSGLTIVDSASTSDGGSANAIVSIGDGSVFPAGVSDGDGVTSDTVTSSTQT